jgi:HlyD family secretion protein
MNGRRDGDDDILERPRHAGHGRPRDVGPQGEALILELQRLRKAFERDDWNETDAERPRRGPAECAVRRDAVEASRPPQRRKGKKGAMGRVIEACFGSFGVNRAAPFMPEPVRPSRQPQPQRATGRQRPPGYAPTKRATPTTQPPRQQGPAASIAPIAMDLQGPATAIAEPNAPLLEREPPHQAQTGPKASLSPGPRLSRLIARCRSGVTFLLDPDEPAVEGENLASATRRTFARELKVGLRVLIAATVLGGGWAALVPLAGAVVVPGSLVVQSNVKAIQHPTGGVVAEIPVRNGSRVKAGDLLLRLDATQAQAGLQVLTKQLDELRARGARLTAERDGLARPDLPDELAPRIGESAVKSLLAAEATLFQARASARENQKGLLRNRIAQLNEEIAGLEAQVGSKARQIELITGELAGVQDLYDKRLVPLPRLTALQRESARIEGERGQLVSAIAETRAKISEAQLQIVRTDQDFRTDVVKELGEARGKEAELAERSVAARDLLDRIELRSPASGLVHQLNVHTIGGVVRGGDTVMEIVPDADDLQIEARLQPADIDQVRVGQQAFTRFPAFNQRVTPEVAGIVSFVSPDLSRDQPSNAGYFTVRVTLPEEERRRLAGLQLVSGMPAEVFMQTGSRTMLSYLFKPITDQLQRAFVER